MKNKNIFSVLMLSLSAFGVGGLSYIYQFTMLKLLDTESFGEFASLVGIINLLAVVTTGFGLFLVKEFSRLDGSKQSNTIIYISIKYGFIMSFIVYVIYAIGAGFIGDYLNISNNLLILITGSGMLLSFTALYQNAYYQAYNYFSVLSLVQFLNPVLRIAIGGLLVWLGYGVIGGILGFILPFYILFFSRYFHIKYIQQTHNTENEIYSKSTEKRIVKDFLSQKKQILQYLITSICIALLMNVDIIIVKNIFDGETAGYYAAVSILTKFLVFLGLSIETVYYPQLVKHKVFPRTELVKVSIYYVVLTLGALGFFFLFGENILRLFKDGLQNYLGLVYPLLIYCGLLAYLSIIVKTLIAFEMYTINYLLGALIVLLIVYLHNVGNTPLLVTQVFAGFGAVGLMLGLSQIFTHKKNEK